MKIKALLATLFILAITSGCAGLIPKPYIQNVPVASGDLNVEAQLLLKVAYTSIGRTQYYPPDNQTMYNLWLKITNNSKKAIKADLTKSYMLEGKEAIGASMYMEGKKFAVNGKKDPVITLKPGETAEYRLVYVLEQDKVPDMFVWKGVGEIKIPQNQS